MKQNTRWHGIAAFALCLLAAGVPLCAVANPNAVGAEPLTLTLYSSRSETLLKPILEAYTQETGVKTTLLNDKNPVLLERLKAEGAASPADLLITVDAGNLWQAAHEGLLNPIHSAVLNAAVPAHLRDPEGRWYGLSVRARTIFYNPKKVKPSALSTYAELAEPAWKGRLCLRSASKVYTQSLVATIIARHGIAHAEKIVRGWVANLAAPVFNEDTKLLEAIGAGQCDVGIANSYYYGRLLEKNPTVSRCVILGKSARYGVHINISGAGVVRHSKHLVAAQKLLEWLASTRAQQLFAKRNYEMPVNPAAAVSDVVARLG